MSTRIGTALVLIASLALSLGGRAQLFVTGTVGGSVGGSSSSSATPAQTTTSNTTFDLSLLPGIGMQLSKDMGVGVLLGYHMFGTSNETSVVSGSVVSETSTTTKNHGMLLNPYAYYYVLHVGSSLSLGLTAGGSLHYGWTATTNTTSTTGGANTATTTSSSGAYKLQLAVAPEVLYRLNANMSLTGTFGLFGLGYSYAVSTGMTPSAPGAHQFHIGVNGQKTAFSVGFRYML